MPSPALGFESESSAGKFPGRARARAAAPLPAALTAEQARVVDGPREQARVVDGAREEVGIAGAEHVPAVEAHILLPLFEPPALHQVPGTHGTARRGPSAAARPGPKAPPPAGEGDGEGGEARVYSPGLAGPEGRGQERPQLCPLLRRVRPGPFPAGRGRRHVRARDPARAEVGARASARAGTRWASGRDPPRPRALRAMWAGPGALRRRPPSCAGSVRALSGGGACAGRARAGGALTPRGIRAREVS